MHLQHHAALKTGGFEPLLNRHHSHLDEISGRPLHRSVNGLTFRAGPDRGA